MKRYFAIILFAAALASCTPKLYDAQVEVPENYRFAGDFPQDSVSLPFAWWEIFGDSTLNRLVEHALENNRNLAQAASRIFEARANIAVARAPFLPSVGLNFRHRETIPSRPVRPNNIRSNRRFPGKYPFSEHSAALTGRLRQLSTLRSGAIGA